MQPYYTIMRLPGEKEAEFIQMLPFTPRRRDNLAAWLVARSDGEHYGRLRVFEFPKQKLVFGPRQVVARISQDQTISPQITLWNQQGSQVIWGTLMVIPVEESLIYVRPLYLRASGGRIPELTRVIVAYQNQIVMEETLEAGLARIFGDAAPAPRRPPRRRRRRRPPPRPHRRRRPRRPRRRRRRRSAPSRPRRAPTTSARSRRSGPATGRSTARRSAPSARRSSGCGAHDAAGRAGRHAPEAHARVRRHPLQRLAGAAERPHGAGRGREGDSRGDRRRPVRALRLGPHRRRRARARPGGAPRHPTRSVPPETLRRRINDALPADINVLRVETGAAAVPRPARRRGAQLPLPDRAAPHRVRQAVRLVGQGRLRRRAHARRRQGRSSASTTSAPFPTTTRRRSPRRCSSSRSTCTRTRTSW